jgi:hypothetical protein
MEWGGENHANKYKKNYAWITFSEGLDTCDFPFLEKYERCFVGE